MRPDSLEVTLALTALSCMLKWKSCLPLLGTVQIVSALGGATHRGYEMRSLHALLRVIGAASLGVLVACVACGCSGNGGGGSQAKRIIILTNGDSPFWDAARAGVDTANTDFKLQDANLKAELETNQGGPTGQLAKLRQYGTQSNIAAIGISPCDASNVAVADELRKLKDKGIKVVTIDSDLDRATLRDARSAFIGTDNLVGGRELGKCLVALRPDGGKYVTFVGRTGAQNAIERITGVKEGSAPKWESLDTMADDEDRTRARQNVRAAAKKNPAPNALIGIWSYNAPAIVDVVTELDQRKDYLIVVFDAEPGAIAAMSEGKVDAMIVQNPYQMGYQGVRMLKAMVQNDEKTLKEMLPNQGKPEGDIFDTGLKVVFPDTGSPLEKSRDKFEKTTEFLKLSAFKDWLAKYHLSQS